MDEKQQRLLKEMMKFSKLTPSSSMKTNPSDGASSSVKTTPIGGASSSMKTNPSGGASSSVKSSMQQQSVVVPGHQLHPQAAVSSSSSSSRLNSDKGTGNDPSGVLKDIVHLKVHNRDDAPLKKIPTPSKGPISYSSDTHFSGSAFMSSPDPSTIPLPVFDLSDDSSCRERSVDFYSDKSTGAVTTSAAVDDHDQTRRTRKPPSLSAKKGALPPPTVVAAAAVAESSASAVQIKSPTSSHNRASSSSSPPSSEETIDKSSVLKRFLKIRQQM